jgi:hypothetical protein
MQLKKKSFEKSYERRGETLGGTMDKNEKRKCSALKHFQCFKIYLHRRNIIARTALTAAVSHHELCMPWVLGR